MPCQVQVNGVFSVWRISPIHDGEYSLPSCLLAALDRWTYPDVLAKIYTPLLASFRRSNYKRSKLNRGQNLTLLGLSLTKGRLSTVTLRVALRTSCALPIRRCWARRAFKTQSRRTYWKQLFPQIPFNTLHDNESVTSLLKSAQEPERNHNACMMLDTSCDSPQ